MTRLLDKLEKEEYIERFSREGDRRVNLIKISKKGSDILNRVWPGYHTKILDIANSMDKEDLKEISQLLVKWCDKLGEK
jgi:DNA-binding MarR family transcriptional regulator